MNRPATPDLVCVALPAWEGTYLKSTVQLMSHLARTHRVLYVDYAHTASDLLRGLVGRAPEVPRRRMLGQEAPLREVRTAAGARLWVLTPPPVLPTGWVTSPGAYDWLQARNARWMAGRIRAAMRQLGFGQPVVVNALNPFVGPALAGQLGERHRVYYCYDEISASLWAGAQGARLEAQYLRQVDATVVSSPGLYQTKSPLTRHCTLIENGVDYDTFATGWVPAFEKTRQAPTLGYLGTLDNRIDFDLLEALARALPAVRLLLVGRVSADQAGVSAALGRLRALPNVQLEGPQPAAALPGYLRQMHVGLIPFLRNDQTAAIYPMKINEYLAAGLPVVSTAFAPLGTLTAVATVAASTEAFLWAVETALRPDEEAVQHARQAVARANGWEGRAAAFARVLAQLQQPTLTHA